MVMDNRLLRPRAIAAVNNTIPIDYLVVAGGGGGGSDYGSGGGAGGVLWGSTTVQVGDSATLVVGAGGAVPANGYDTYSNSGSQSQFLSFIATGGGGGAQLFGASWDSQAYGLNGGSGGGGPGLINTAADYRPSIGGLGVSGQGHNGGNGTWVDDLLNDYPTGGGGGAAYAGDSGISGYSGFGGDGIDYPFDSAPAALGLFAGGGGGGGYVADPSVSRPTLAGEGGAGGGGNGAQGIWDGVDAFTADGQDGAANRGGGGGGASGGGAIGGLGGSGVVILRFPNSFDFSTLAHDFDNTNATATHKIVIFQAGTGQVTFTRA